MAPFGKTCGASAFVMVVVAALAACLTGDPNPYYASSGGLTSTPSSGLDASGGSSGEPPGPPTPTGDTALATEAIGDCVTFVDNDLPTGKADRTVEIWVKTTFMGEGYAVSYGTARQEEGFAVGMFRGKAIVTQIGDSISSTKNIADNQWHHIAVTYTGSTNDYAVYTDGEPDGNKTMPTDTVKIGKASIGMWVPEKKSLIGIMDEARVWKVARSAADIKADMSKRLSGSEPNLVAYYALDASGRGAGISIPNLAAAASIHTGLTEGSSATFVPGRTSP